MAWLLSNEFLIGLYAINLGLVCFLVFFDKREPSSVLTWSVILLFVPFFGLILYLFLGFGPHFGAKKKFLTKFSDDKKFQQLVGQQRDALDASAFREEIKELARFNLDSNSLFSVDNEAQVFTDVGEFYEDMLREIEKAKSFIHAEFFIIRDDESGRKFVNALAKKAFEGLKVRVLFDDLGCARLRKNFFDCIVKSGGEVVPFFPSKLRWLKWNLNFRNHRKMVVIDGVCVYTWSSNIGNEYKGLNNRISPWIDCNLKIRGTAAMHYNLRFLQDFSFASGRQVEMEFNEHGVKSFLPVQVLSDGPDTNQGAIKQAYIKAIYSAKERVFIQTPYLIPDEAFKLALVTVAKCGVDVRIMIPAKPDKGYVYLATQAYAAELAKAGVKIYMRKGFLHSKTLLVDDDISSIGTFNIDTRSFKLQFEVTIFIYDKGFGKQLEKVFMEDLKQSAQLDSFYQSSKSWGRLAKERFMKLLTPLL